MFAQLVEAVADDFVKYVMHLDVVVEQPAEPDVSNVQYTAADDPVQGAGAVAQAAVRQAVDNGEPLPSGVAAEELAAGEETEAVVTVVKSEQEKLGRNEKCWCGSDKKFKLCHGK